MLFAATWMDLEFVGTLDGLILLSNRIPPGWVPPGKVGPGQLHGVPIMVVSFPFLAVAGR